MIVALRENRSVFIENRWRACWRVFLLLFIHETPLHFAIVVLICAITFGSLLLAILAVNRAEGKTRWTRIFGLLFVLSILLMYLVFAISMAMLPATASVVELLPFYIVIWGFAGLHGLFIILFCLGARFLSKRIWVLLLIVLGGAVYVAMLFLLPNPFTVFTVSDGWLNYVAMPLVLVMYAIFLGAIYMFLIPLYVGIQLNKRMKGSMKGGLWIGWIGLFLSFLGAVLISAVQFTVAFVLYAFVLVATAWVLNILGIVLTRLYTKPTAE